MSGHDVTSAHAAAPGYMIAIMAHNSASSDDVPASYSFRGAAAELERTFPLSPSEHVITEGTLRIYRSPASQRMGYLRLTDTHLLLLRHYAFRRDSVTVIDPSAIRCVELVGVRLRLDWMGGSEPRCEMLAPWSGRAPVPYPIKDLCRLANDIKVWAEAAR